MTEFVKRACLICVDELLAAFLKFSAVVKLTEANGSCKKYGFLLCFDLLFYGRQLVSLRGYFYVWSSIINSLIIILIKPK